MLVNTCVLMLKVQYSHMNFYFEDKCPVQLMGSVI